MRIKIKDLSTIEAMNKVLEERGIDYKFWGEEDTKAWLDDINNNPKSPSRKLKPKDRPLTLKELKEMFPYWTEVGIYETDLYYGRTSQEQMQKLGKFINDYSDYIEYVDGSDTLLERGNIPEEYHPVIAKLEKEYVPPKELPMEEQYKPDFQSGLLLCKSWGDKPFWTIFGKVDSPKFLKERIYEEDIYNNLYKDKNGYGYMLIPLNDLSKDFGNRVFNGAWEIGLREHECYFLPMVYDYMITNIGEVGESFSGFYSERELIERFKTVANRMIFENPQWEIKFFLNNKNEIRIGYDDNNVKLGVLNALKFAMENKLGKLKEITFNTFRFEKNLITLF
jgi:hypothetical protein